MKAFIVIFIFAFSAIVFFMITVSKSKKKGCCGNTECSCKKDKR